jgi:hypothetical protein
MVLNIWLLRVVVVVVISTAAVAVLVALKQQLDLY